MGRLIATIRYGSAKIRIFLLTVFVLIVGGTGTAIYGGVKYELLPLAIGVAMLIAGLLMIFLANFSTEAIDKGDDEEEEADKDDTGIRQEGKERKHKASRTFASEKKTGIDASDPDEAEEFVLPEDDEEAEKEKKSKRKRSRRRDNDAVEEDSAPGNEAGIRTSDNSLKNDRKAAADKLKKQENDNELVSKYTPVVIKQMLHRYKVKRDYTEIIIDDSRKFDTARTPALCWTKRKNVYFLLMEGNERVESMPLAQFLQVTYKRDVKEDNLEAYSRIKNDMGVYERFEDVMPTFASTPSRIGPPTYTKNQYVLGGIVAVTPRSIRALRARYNFDIKIYDSLKLTGDYSIYFKRAFEARILWTDQVIGQQEYQNMIGAILQRMVDDRSVSRYDFLDDLERMINNRLITTEYADYYMQQRQKRDQAERKR